MNLKYCRLEVFRKEYCSSLFQGSGPYLGPLTSTSVSAHDPENALGHRRDVMSVLDTVSYFTEVNMFIMLI